MDTKGVLFIAQQFTLICCLLSTETEKIACPCYERGTDYPETIIDVFKGSELRRDKSDLFSRMRKLGFDHLFVAKMKGTILQTNDDYIKYYIALGEKKFEKHHC